MKVEIVTTIARDVDTTWTRIADEFTSIEIWFDGVITSTPLAQRSEFGPLGGRVCTFTDDPNGPGAVEPITVYDRENHRLAFDVHDELSRQHALVRLEHPPFLTGGGVIDHQGRALTHDARIGNHDEAPLCVDAKVVEVRA